MTKMDKTRRKGGSIGSRHVMDDATVEYFRVRDALVQEGQREDRKLYGSTGVRRVRRLSAVELRAAELVRQRGAGVTGGEQR